ncbi:DUF3261 domain-containing protein [Pseudomonas knackmussii]|uniref:DUF3261 domain-containing protein n=1 Tax=Pseudomonas knackmussii TaxID=65741 RepID=A0ABY4KSW4_9PSED|nr:DUF3261 domain-containing protein [Pseudomonas knackmussii]UPQ83291.1 DUF3261 domain-containing protein [Pseudomonas knackmussii]
MILPARYARSLALLSLALMLVACAQRMPLPSDTPRLSLPMQLHIQHDQDGTRDWLLVIQQEGRALRWSLLDPLGIPLARQLLLDGRWQADGLLPPNPQARELFAALLFALTPAEQLADLYSHAAWTLQHDGRTLVDGAAAWHVRYLKDERIELDVGPALTYRVAPIATAGVRH